MSNELLHNEKELLLQVAEADEDAFTSLYCFYQPRLHRYIFPFTNGSVQDTEEVIQDVFIKLWLHKDMLPAIQSFAHYIFRMARNRLIDLQLRQQKQQASLQAIEQTLAHAAEPITEHLLLNDYKKLAREAIHNLSPQKKNIFLLRYEHDKSLDEIAATLGITKTSVKNQLYKAVHEVKQALQLKGGINLPLILLL